MTGNLLQFLACSTMPRSHAFWVAGTKWGGNHETQEYELGNSNCARRRGASCIFVSSCGAPGTQSADLRGGSRVAEGATPMEARRCVEHCDRRQRQCLGPAPAADAQASGRG